MLRNNLIYYLIGGSTNTGTKHNLNGDQPGGGLCWCDVCDEVRRASVKVMANHNLFTGTFFFKHKFIRNYNKIYILFKLNVVVNGVSDEFDDCAIR